MAKQTRVPKEPRTRVVVEIHTSVDRATEIEAARLGMAKWEVIEAALCDFLKLKVKGAA